MANTGPYLLRQLAAELPLSADGPSSAISITCVEIWNGNLYIGTSAGEVLHFVLLPPGPDDTSADSAVILASRQQPPATNASKVGVQQIQLLPSVGKACILCNNTLSFYSLPELSPAFPSTKPLSCAWIGGIDLNVDINDASSRDGAMIMICQKSRIRLVRVSEDGPRGIRNIEFAACLASVRRETVACVADIHSYALLDVEHQQKIPLFPISSIDEEAFGAVGGAAEAISQPQSHTVSRSVSSASTSTKPAIPLDLDRGHGRSSSLGIFAGGDPQRAESPRPRSSQRYGFDAPPSLGRMQSPGPSLSPERQVDRAISPARTPPVVDKPLPTPPNEASIPAQTQALPTKNSFVPLKPHIVSPTPEEFLLTTGTSPSEPGVGMFVNLDGDVVRGTIEFSRYPDAVVVDGDGLDPSTSLTPDSAPEEGYVLASLRQPNEETGETISKIEIQRWDVDPGENASSKAWIELARSDTLDSSMIPGLRKVATPNEITLSEVGQKLSLRRLVISLGKDQNHGTDDDVAAQGKGEDSNIRDAAREKEGAEFINSLSNTQTQVVAWAGDRIWWAVRNPTVIRLDSVLERAQCSTPQSDSPVRPDRAAVEKLLANMRGQEPTTELEYLSLGYVRQKASLLLLMDLIIRTSSNIIVFAHEVRAVEEALTEGDIDPRLVLALLPLFKTEVVPGPEGIWVYGGLKKLIETFLGQNKSDLSRLSSDPTGPFGDNLLPLMKRFLLAWRRKKGFGSIADEKEVFRSVDAALVHVLLLLDTQSPRGSATAGSLRAELNSVIDNGVDCFDRVVFLLEQHKRLFLLSRLYQSRKLSSKVLATWKRMINGEHDAGGEFTDGEQEVRKYLSKLRDRTVVEEYGIWLADRNPNLGVQVFADDYSRVKFEPAEVVALLKEKAPGAVKVYLEHLVFGKKHVQYANDLINYYLEIVLDELKASEPSRSLLLDTYLTYKALHPPKPTYRQFVADNGIQAEWWTSRLRLLQLLGSNQGASFSYDVDTILSRLAPYERELVPEMIILHGQQGQHKESIRLLTHGLGDFDTAIRYCLLGGSNIFRTASGQEPHNAIPSREEQTKLFQYLLHEFLQIESLDDRIERTGELLERFGSWFDLSTVLSMLPDSWSIDIFSGFLINALRRLVKERSETSITKSLNKATNLRLQGELIDRVDELGLVVEKVR